MNKQLTEALFKDFPKLFRDKDKSPRETLICFGFECGDGWEPLIRECAAKLEAINNTIENPENYIAAVQVKEKFGGLRFYLNFHTTETDEAIRVAEEKADVTCETCGQPGTAEGSKGWICTLCAPCREKYNKAREERLTKIGLEK